MEELALDFSHTIVWIGFKSVDTVSLPVYFAHYSCYGYSGYKRYFHHGSQIANFKRLIFASRPIAGRGTSNLTAEQSIASRHCTDD